METVTFALTILPRDKDTHDRFLFLTFYTEEKIESKSKRKINKTRTAKVGAISKAQNCKRGTLRAL